MKSSSKFSINNVYSNVLSEVVYAKALFSWIFEEIYLKHQVFFENFKALYVNFLHPKGIPKAGDLKAPNANRI